MMAFVPIIFIVVMIMAVLGKVKPNQVVLFIIYLMVGPMIIACILTSARDLFASLSLFYKALIFVVGGCLVMRLVLPGDTWFVVLKTVLFAPFRLMAWLLRIIFDLPAPGQRRRAQRPNINQ